MSSFLSRRHCLVMTGATFRRRTSPATRSRSRGTRRQATTTGGSTSATTGGRHRVDDGTAARCEIQADGCSFLTKWDQSTDEATPQDQLQYDFVDWTGLTNVYDLTSGTTGMGAGGVPAVDVAGNRSPFSSIWATGRSPSVASAKRLRPIGRFRA